MKYYLKDAFLHDNHAKNAGNKARDDVESILLADGYQALELKVDNWYQMSFLQAQQHKSKALQAAFDQLQAGDELLMQFPIIHHTFLIGRLMKRLQKKGAKIFLLIHDLETIRHAHSRQPWRQKVRNYFQEQQALKLADGLIVHNPVMKQVLVNKGLEADKIVSLEIFDYLIPAFEEQTRPELGQPIMVAGNLIPEKSGYLYALPAQPAYNLYGVGFDEKRAADNVSYFGSFMPDELPPALRGSFGLVWDGDRADTCSGTYGNYLRYNNSHKTSLYLAAGFPVIVWKESALAGFILEKGCGLAVSSLYDLEKVLSELSEEAYEDLLAQARLVGQELRQGHYLKTALIKLS